MENSDHRTDYDKVTIIAIENCTLDLEWDEPEYRLAHLLAKDVIFMNNGHWIDIPQGLKSKDQLRYLLTQLKTIK